MAFCLVRKKGGIAEKLRISYYFKMELSVSEIWEVARICFQLTLEVTTDVGGNQQQKGGGKKKEAVKMENEK